MRKLVLLGDEAIAQGALDAGLSGVYAYPGTPSTEITEYIQASDDAKKGKVHSEWSANEKTALEAGLGMAYAGKRAMVCMKHVGLNVAADAFMNSALTGVNGGLVITVADDPGMHSSQNEQDSRFYGKFAMVPVFEPSNQQEAYDMIPVAFHYSEKYKIPVLVRITTRLAHSRAIVETGQKQVQNSLNLPGDLKQFILLPSIARKKFSGLLDSQPLFQAETENSSFNVLLPGKDHKKGIIACGLAFNYYAENARSAGLDYPVIKIGQYPVPRKHILELVEKVDEIIVFEEGYPLVEEMLRGFFDPPCPVRGRMDGTLPRDGELTPNLVAIALGLENISGPAIPEVVKGRPPALCKGCSHADVYYALNEALETYTKGRVFSDIGCYTLGALPPFDAINSCVDMGASITMAKGAADAGLFPSVAVIGDSTFTHSGMTGLLDAVLEESPVTIIISDNSTTGMTGGQKSAATGRLVRICTGLGVEEEHVKVLDPIKKNHAVNVSILKDELEYRGVSVIIAQRECIQTATRRKKQLRSTN